MPGNGARLAPALEPRASHFFVLALDLLKAAGHGGYLQQVNPAFIRTFGYTDAELRAQPFMAFVHPDDRNATNAELERVLRGQPAHGFEHRFRCRDGTFRWLSWTAIATPNAVVYGAARDVTERKTSTAKAHRDQFLVALSHDLQQPLTVIKAQAQVMQRRIARGETVESARVEQCLAYINTSVMRMHRMIQQLLDESVAESGRAMALVLNPTDVVAVVREAVEEHQLAFDTHQFELDVQHPRLLAMLDRARFENALSNLLSNAVKYSPEGGRIRIRVSQVRSATGRVARIVVEDEGIGIPRDDLPHIFDRFHRGSNVVSRIAGTGLGLAGVRQMVELQGGSISVKSKLGVGSTFTLRLPVSVPNVRRAG